MSSPIRPNFGDVWMVELDPIRGHEHGGTRPAVVISTDRYNHGPAQLVVVAPMTRRDRGVRLHLRLTPPDARVDETSVVLCDAVRSISTQRLSAYLGRLSPGALAHIARRLQILFNLPIPR